MKVEPEWNTEHAQKLQALEDLFKATRESIVFLKAAQEVKVSPEAFQLRVNAEQARQDKIIARMIDFVKKNGGKVKVGKPEDGIFGVTSYFWSFDFELTGGHRLCFSFGRCFEPEVYNVPLSHQWTFHQKRGRTGWYKYMVEMDSGYHDCESVPELRAYIKRALKWISESLGKKTEIKK